MPDTKISALSDAGALTGAEIVPLANGGANERTTTQAIADLAAGGGAVSLVSTLTASASATLDFTGLSGTHWILVGKLLRPASSGAIALIRVGTGAGPTYKTTGYYFGGTRSGATISEAIAAIAELNQNAWRTGQQQDSTQRGLSFVLDIVTENAVDVNIMGHMTGCSSADGHTRAYAMGGLVDSIGAPLTAIRFLESAGNITQGTLSLYAVDD